MKYESSTLIFSKDIKQKPICVNTEGMEIEKGP